MSVHVPCGACGHDNVFDQPYPYHAGFGNQGFLYNDAGNCTLVWGSYDPAYVALLGQRNPWSLDAGEWARLEAALLPAPDGTSWRASNPARCVKCGGVIRRSMANDEISFLVYPNSVDLDEQPSGRGFASVLRERKRA